MHGVSWSHLTVGVEGNHAHGAAGSLKRMEKTGGNEKHAAGKHGYLVVCGVANAVTIVDHAHARGGVRVGRLPYAFWKMQVVQAGVAADEGRYKPRVSAAVDVAEPTFAFYGPAEREDAFEMFCGYNQGAARGICHRAKFAG